VQLVRLAREKRCARDNRGLDRRSKATPASKNVLRLIAEQGQTSTASLTGRIAEPSLPEGPASHTYYR